MRHYPYLEEGEKMKADRFLLFGTMILILALAACAPATQPPISDQAATLAAQLTSSPIAGETGTPGALTTPSVEVTGTVDPSAITGTPAAVMTHTAGIPVTGADTVLLICQFCLDRIPYALVAIPEAATFNMVDAQGTVIEPDPAAQTGCNAVQTITGRQLVLCNGAELESINLSVCTDANNCSQVSVRLQQCPQAGSDDGGGGTGTATLPAGTGTATPSAEATGTPVPTNTP
jgi:hypothetical protein